MSVVDTHLEHDVRIPGDPAVHRCVRVDVRAYRGRCRLPTTTRPTPVPTALNPDIRRSVAPRHRALAATMPCPRCDSPAPRPGCGKCRWVVAHATGWAQPSGLLNTERVRALQMGRPTTCHVAPYSVLPSPGWPAERDPTTPAVVTPRDGPGMEYGTAESHRLWRVAQTADVLWKTGPRRWE